MKWEVEDFVIAILSAALVFSVGWQLFIGTAPARCIREGSAVVDGKRYICVEYKINE